MSIEIGPITCMNCIFKDAGIALSDNYKMQESADTYDYNFYESIDKLPEKMTSTKYIEKINLVNVRNSMVIQHYRFGRFGNFLFTLADLAIITEQFKQYFRDNNVEMLTSWHETYFTDIQSRQKNIYKYKGKLTPSEIQQKNKEKQEYILSKIKIFQNAKRIAHQELITGLPAWESEYDIIHGKKF